MATFLQYLVEADTDFFLKVNSWHSPFWDVFMPLFSAKYVWVYFYASLLYVIIRNYSIKVTLLWLLAVVVLITFCDQFSASVIRPMVARLRPSNLDNPLSEVVHVVNGYRGGNYSFPSAHAANSWALAAFMTLLFRRTWISCTVVLWAIVTCYSRLYLGVHYFGDLLVGMFIGCLFAALVYYLLVWIARIKKPLEVRHAFMPIYTLGITIVCFLVIAAIETYLL
jgi:undecaprenyl-diphosphatase